jgi:hypothetical protein
MMIFSILSSLFEKNKETILLLPLFKDSIISEVILGILLYILNVLICSII